MGSLNSVKSSKKKVVSAKKVNGRCQMKAKKIGKATISAKCARGTWKHKITVKKTNFKVSFKKMGKDDRYALVTLKNDTSGSFDSFKVDITFRDSNGNALYNTTSYIRNVLKKQSGSDMAYLGTNYDKVDLSKTTYKVSFTRYIDHKYKDYSDKVAITEKLGKDKYSNDCINVTAKTSYKGKGNIYVRYDVTFYDATGKEIYFSSYGTMLYDKGQQNTTSIAVYKGYSSYKNNKRVMLIE